MVYIDSYVDPIFGRIDLVTLPEKKPVTVTGRRILREGGTTRSRKTLWYRLEDKTVSMDRHFLVEGDHGARSIKKERTRRIRRVLSNYCYQVIGGNEEVKLELNDKNYGSWAIV